jgi:hypothetical protein
MGINLKPNEADDVPTIPVRENKARDPAEKHPQDKPAGHTEQGGATVGSRPKTPPGG